MKVQQPFMLRCLIVRRQDLQPHHEEQRTFLILVGETEPGSSERNNRRRRTLIKKEFHSWWRPWKMRSECVTCSVGEKTTVFLSKTLLSTWKLSQLQNIHHKVSSNLGSAFYLLVLFMLQSQLFEANKKIKRIKIITFVVRVSNPRTTKLLSLSPDEEIKIKQKPSCEWCRAPVESCNNSAPVTSQTDTYRPQQLYI